MLKKEVENLVSESIQKNLTTSVWNSTTEDNLFNLTSSTTSNSTAASVSVTINPSKTPSTSDDIRTQKDNQSGNEKILIILEKLLKLFS